jgi:hypothetical protein
MDLPNNTMANGQTFRRDLRRGSDAAIRVAMFLSTLQAADFRVSHARRRVAKRAERQ